ncbi:MAG: hypothetical protein N3E49_02850 [Bacteroidia bacterium]|nr:hypothetical protein [Bacteroidia bacterium]
MTTPTLPLTLSQACDTACVVRIVLRRDPLTDQPEWVSGHRYAITFYLEQLPVQAIVIETPWEDTAFFRAGSEWEVLLTKWLTEDFLPFLRPYNSIRYIIFGRDFRKAPLKEDSWRNLLVILRKEDPERQWGFCGSHPDSIPACQAWDLLAMDYRLFYPPHARPDYHARWEAVQKPLVLLYPNLYEPDKATALKERQRYWKKPPIALVLASS